MNDITHSSKHYYRSSVPRSSETTEEDTNTDENQYLTSENRDFDPNDGKVIWYIGSTPINLNAQKKEDNIVTSEGLKSESRTCKTPNPIEN